MKYGWNNTRISCRGLFTESKILTFTSIHLLQCFKYVRHVKPKTNNKQHGYFTRAANDPHRSYASNASVIENAIKQYNMLPKRYKVMVCDKSFIKEVKKWLIQNEFYNMLRNTMNFV